MSLTTGECADAVVRHTRALADAAEAHLDRPVQHCPGWTVADLVWHLTEVQWFWRWVATERPTERPAYVESPERPADGQLVDTLRSGADALAATLLAADQDAPCWTWGTEQRVGFITRHQVQEAAVHHWDALDAATRAYEWAMRPQDSADAIEEFLSQSVANQRWPRPDAAPLGGTIRFAPDSADGEADAGWLVVDGDQPGTVRVRAGAVDGGDGPAGPVVTVGADPGTMLLWLYGRVPDEAVLTDLSSEARGLLDRFRALASTD